MKVQVYLFFHGRCEEAIGFYKRTLGFEVTMLMRFKDSPEPPQSDMARRVPTTKSCMQAFASATPR